MLGLSFWGRMHLSDMASKSSIAFVGSTPPAISLSIQSICPLFGMIYIHQYSPFVHYLEILHGGFCNGYSTPVLPNYYIKLNQCACKRRNIHEEKNKVKVRNKVAGIKIIWHFQWVGMCFHGFWLGLLLLEITFW